MIPRDYQRAAVAAARAKTAAHGETLVAPAGGGGKTAVAGFYIGEEAAALPGSRFLVLQHTDELIEQNQRHHRPDHRPAHLGGQGRAGRLVRPGGLRQRADPGRVPSGGPYGRGLAPRSSTSATAPPPTATRRSSRTRARANPGLKLLGLSGHARARRRPEPAQDLLEHRLPPADLGADPAGHPGAAANLHGRRRRLGRLGAGGRHRRRIRHGRRRGGAEPGGGERGGGGALARSAPRDRRTIAFCATVAHAEAVAAAFRAAGITAETVTGEMPAKERAALLARFDRGEVQVLTNCMVLTEGFDSQPVGCIVVLRPMLHSGTFIQAIGRGLRKVDPERFPGVVKTDCVVLDFAGAAQRHGSIEHDGTLPRARSEPGQAPYKMCPECEAEMPLGTMACPFCGHVWQRRSPREAPAPALRADRDRPAGPLALPLVGHARRRPGADRRPASTPGPACSSTGSTGTRRQAAAGAAAPPRRRRARTGAGRRATTSCARPRPGPPPPRAGSG